MEEIKYKFTAISINDTKEVFPQNGNTLLVTWEKDDERAFFSKKLKGKMLFTGDDFHWLYVYESSQYRCETIQLIIEKNCEGFSEFFIARLILNNADWDLDQCTCSIEAQVEDRYTCYDDNKDKEVNLIQVTYPKQTVQLVQGSLETLYCTGSSGVGGDPQFCGDNQSEGWVVQSFYETNPPPDAPDPTGTFQITWVRETIFSSELLSAPWIDLGSGQYAREPARYGYRTFGGQYDYGYDYQVGGSIDNGMRLKDAFQSMLNQFCYPMRVKSRFFNWDPDPVMNANILDPLKSTPYADLDIYGQIVPSANIYHKVTDFIRVIPGTQLWLQNPGTVGAGNTNNSFYDENKAFISNAPAVPGASTPVKIADIPNNVHFVRYQYYDMDVPGAEVMLYLGTGAVAFVPYNYNNYVTGQRSKVDNLILFQKSDVKRPNGTGNASVANITFEKLNRDICNMFNLKWDIDNDGNFIIEHVSFFQKGVGLNLVGRFDERLRAGMRKYSYDIDNMPRREVFQMADLKYTYGDFRGYPIVYANACVGQGEKEDKDWIVENIMTDVALVLNNPNSDSQVVSDDGFVLMACDESNNILSEASIIGGNVINNTLAWSRLHVDYWRYERVFNDFMMNNVFTTALSVIRTKKQVPIEVVMCCEDFDPEELVMTEMGEGAVAEASFDLYKETLKLTLLYNPEEELIMNEPPVAVNDEAETFMNLAIDIDVLANDTDEEGLINPGTLLITIGAINGTASVVDGKIRYIPNTGYTGEDFIRYTVKDNWSAESNVGIVTITVKPGSPLPIANSDSFTTAEDTALTVGNMLSNDSGDGSLQCIPETKATDEGGSVQIYTDGSFVYIPPTGFTGTDTFTYTMKDSNDNEAEGNVSIVVFERQTVYVRYSETNTQVDTSYFPCPVSGGEEPLTVERTVTTVDQLWEYFSDSGATTPMNVDGYSLILKMQQERSGTGASTTPYDVPASGTSDTNNEAITVYTQDACPGDSGTSYTNSYSLLPSPNYTVI